jgi:methyl-accepting chemotaxis protein
MTIENDDLADLRETTSKILLTVLCLHIPIAMSIGLMRGAPWLVPAAFTLTMAVAAMLSWWASGNGLSTRLVFAVALIGDVSMFVFQLAGHAWQIDAHIYFFAALACLVAYCDYRPIIAGTLAVVLHHLTLNFIVPAAVYPDGADLGRVVFHALILLTSRSSCQPVSRRNRTGQARPRCRNARTRSRLRAQDRRYRRGRCDGGRRDAEPVVVDEQQQR